MVNSCRLDSLSGVDSGVSESSVLCIISLSHGSSLPVLASAGGAIVFVLEGQVGAVASSGAISPISSGNMFFMPSHSNTEYVSVTASRILLCKFSYDVNPCLLSSFQQILSSGSLPPSAGMCALPFCETVSHFIDSLLLAGHEILSYPQYQQTKRDEVLMYILSGYPERELSGFFSHISVSELIQGICSLGQYECKYLYPSFQASVQYFRFGMAHKYEGSRYNIRNPSYRLYLWRNSLSLRIFLILISCTFLQETFRQIAFRTETRILFVWRKQIVSPNNDRLGKNNDRLV